MSARGAKGLSGPFDQSQPWEADGGAEPQLAGIGAPPEAPQADAGSVISISATEDTIKRIYFWDYASSAGLPNFLGKEYSWQTRDGTATAAGDDYTAVNEVEGEGYEDFILWHYGGPVDHQQEGNEVFYVDAVMTGTYFDANFNVLSMQISLTFAITIIDNDTQTLFTPSDDFVFFDALTFTEAEYIERGDQVYNAGAGDDWVVLPNVADYQLTSSVAWNPANTFYAGDGDDEVDTADGNDRVDGGAGNDLIYGSAGADTLYGGDGADEFVYETGNAGAFTQLLDGGGQPTASTPDLIEFDGSRDQYKFSVSLGATWEDTVTTISWYVDGGLVIHTNDIEGVEFGAPLAGQAVGPVAGFAQANLYTDAARQMIDVYSADRSTLAEARHWLPVEAMQFVMQPKSFGGGIAYTFTNGAYVHQAGPTEVACTVMEGVFNGQRVVTISFEGSNDLVDFLHDFGFLGDTASYYENFQPFVDGLVHYLDDNFGEFGIDQIDRVVVTGHSLGGAMTERLLDGLMQAGYRAEGITFGSIGVETPLTSFPSPYNPAANPNLVNFVHTGDVALALGHTLNSNTRHGATVWINTSLAHTPIGQHLANSYLADLNFLVTQASLAGPFNETSLAAALRNGTVWTGEGPNHDSIQVATGSDGADVVYSYNADDYVIAGAGNDTICVGSPFLGSDTFAKTSGRSIDGGAGADSLLVSGKYADYTMTSGGGAVALFRDGKAVGELYDVERIIYTDGVRDVAGALLSHQTSAAGATSFSVDHAFVYAVAGEGAMTVTGTDQADIIYALAGDKTISGNGGNDIIIVEPSGAVQAIAEKSIPAVAAPAINFIDGGAGADMMVGGAENDTYIVDNESDIVVDAGGVDEVRASVDFSLSDGIERLTLSGAADYGQGNASANVLVGAANADFLDGGDGADTLDGGAGADSMLGGLGDDVFYVDTAGDVVMENVGEGVDTIRSTIAIASLMANVENIEMLGAAVAANGNELNNRIMGNAANNAIDGKAGADTLDGGLGADTMAGGAGDDALYVDNPGDVVIENAGEGTDTLYSSIGVAVLIDNVENLQMLGSAALATGNGLANRITGNAAANTIDGKAGADTMLGGAGNDVYFIDNSGDIVTETAGNGTDIVFSTVNVTSLAQNVENLTLQATALTATGNSLNNVITGNAQNNTLNGGSGEDTLIGGFGNDTYVVNSSGDVVTEAASAGFDTIISSIDIATLALNVDNLTLTGSALTGGGNDLANVIIGNALGNTLSGGIGGDQLNGAGGADTMSGGVGDDSYLVENVGDVVIENSGEGFDTLYAFVSISSLAANVEKLTLMPAGGAIDGTANNLDNRLNGNDSANVLTALDGADVINGLGGNDHIIGGAGLDNITGGAGNDVFVYQAVSDSGLTGATRDLINDFTQGQDSIDLSAIDAITGGSDDAFSFIGTGAFTHVAGQLRYDLINPAGTANDFTVIGMDVNGDGAADSQITLRGLVSLTGADFVL